MATIWVVAVVEFVRMDKAPLILSFGIGFDPLVGELTFQRLVVSRIAALLHV